MKANISVIFILMSAALGMQELDEANCANVPVKSDRSLIQFQKAAATPLQLVDSAGNEETEDGVKIAELFAEVLAQAEAEEEVEEEKGPALLDTDWTGLMVDVELADTAPDMQHTVEKVRSDYAASDDVATALASNVSKPYLEMSFPQVDGAQIVSNSTSDKILMFGFKRGTTGLTNVNASRIWTKKPGSPGAKLVYGFTMMEVPGTKPWKYNIEYSITPPAADVFKVFPKGGKVAQVGNNLAIVMMCNDEDLCKDKKINIAAVQFKPSGDKMKSPEAIVPKENSLVARQDAQAQQAGSMFNQVLMRDAAAKKDQATTAGDFLVSSANQPFRSEQHSPPLPSSGQMQTDIPRIGAAELFSQALEGKEDWTGNVIDVEFAKSSADMRSVAALPYTDYAGVNLSGNVTKTFYEMSFIQTEGSQIVSNASKDKIYVYGFERATSGIKNVNANRIWTGKPGKAKSRLVYGIIMTGAEGPGEWRYNLEFLQPPPQIKFKTFPPDGKVGKKDGHLFVSMTCDEPEGETECDDGNVVVSAVQFTRADKKTIKQPEEVKAISQAAL